MNNYIEFKPIEPPVSNEVHSFQIRSFFKPLLCIYCKDYIWGEGFIGYSCLNCSQCVHNKCRLFINQLKCSNDDKTTIDKISRTTLYPVENWSVNVVREWLAVVNLHRYSEIFGNYGINGAKLLTLDIYQLSAFRIRDTYHHNAILEARDELIRKAKLNSNIQQIIIEQEEAKNILKSNQFKPHHHHFIFYSVSKSTNCKMCKFPLLGIIHQGLQCQKCGIVTHRQCSHLGLPECKSNPEVFKPRKKLIFGANLIDLMTEIEGLEAPLILQKLFKNIEERAYQNNEDLYDVYRLSADTCKIEKIKDYINENGLELVNFDIYDLNTVAALVKTFLRDLQDSIIPECLYEKLVNKIQIINLEELKTTINQCINPLNFKCLKFIMSHLIRVWNFQHKVRGCHYMPDKLFHIFRSVLLRPQWEEITNIVYNLENQILVIQRLILEFDWGVELPEYKVRPKRPANPVENEFSLRSIAGVKSENSDSNNEHHWFWGDINRDDTHMILKNCPDGSFLVRNSSDKNLDSPYTLCVIKSSQVKSIKIFCQEQSNGCFFDIEKPCRFDSLSSLISYYSRVSLKEYNHNLNLVLTYGVSKYKFGKTTQWSIDKLYSSFRDAFHQYEKLTKKYENLESEIGNIREDLGQKKIAMEAYDKVIQVYMEQIDKVNRVLNENLYKKTNAISTTRLLVSQLMPIGLHGKSNQGIRDEEVDKLDNIMKLNREKLDKRIKELNEKKENLRSDIDHLTTVISQLQEEIDILRPELIELRKKRENYHMWLMQRGENDDKIQDNLKSLSKIDLNQTNESKNLTSPSTISLSSNVDTDDYAIKEVDFHSNSINWFLPDCNREQAIEKLSSKPDGTYLVRTNRRPNSKYILSMMCKNEIKHILIEENQTGCFIKSSFIKKRMIMNTSREDLMNDSLSSTSSQSLNTSYEETKSDEFKLDEILKFKTLTELIVYYSKNPIKIGNLVLENNLIFPILSQNGNLITKL